jgi:SAM-dependent methyltransferase
LRSILKFACVYGSAWLQFSQRRRATPPLLGYDDPNFRGSWAGRLMSFKITAREMLRGAAFVAGFNGLLTVLRRMRGNTFKVDTDKNLRDRFTEIYDHGLWRMRQDHPSSGGGSTQTAASSVAQALPRILQTTKASRILDIGCGDFTWMQAVSTGATEYVGVDIVRSVIDANIARFSAQNRKFLCLDATTDPLPPADLALCRDVLFHLGFADARSLIRNICQTSGAAWLMATNDPTTFFNANIESGDFRIINLERAPFHFARPAIAIDDSQIMPGRILGVWQVSTLPDWTRG